MVIILKENAEATQVEMLKNRLLNMGFKLHESEGEQCSLIGLVGDTSSITEEAITGFAVVEKVQRISDPYKRASRKFQHADSIIKAGDVTIGGGTFTFMAGPCSVESQEQICEIAREVKKAGATVLRGGAYKPRTSPYAFQGMRDEGIKLLQQARQETGLKIVTEIMDLSQLEHFTDVDIIQVGARNMQNFELLKELGNSTKDTKQPILLKRGLASTIQEWLMSAEYFMAGGNESVILCERGIRTFETATRNTLDLSCIPVLKELTHLPIIIDPSHAVGIARFVKPMSIAAAAAGADGLIIEVHNDPANAMCDGQQSIKPDEFADLTKQINKLLTAMRAD
jgi:3-deoxy-7-phosphoheptulonate synthase